MSIEDDALLSPDEAARYLRSNPRTIERWRTEGNGPTYVKVGKRVAYQRAALDAWILQREHQSTAEAKAANHD